MIDRHLPLIRSLKQHLETLSGLGITELPCPTGPAPADPMPSAVLAPPATQPNKTERLAHVAQEAERCRRCPLHTSRTHMVFSDGTADAQLVFVGEAPGHDEDLQGIPFVGAAGQLLTRMIEAIGLKREQVYICNVLKDRPPGNRTPLPEEMEACLPFLQEQLAVVQPKVICALGATAARALLGPGAAITRVRGTLHDYHGTPVVPTFHPAYLLRNPDAKKQAWADLKLVRSLLDS